MRASKFIAEIKKLIVESGEDDPFVVLWNEDNDQYESALPTLENKSGLNGTSVAVAASDGKHVIELI